MKQCTRCGASKPASDFHKDRHTKDGLSHGCRSCNIARVKAYAEANVEKVRESKRRTQRKLRPQRRDAHLRKLYGIDLEEYDRLLASQGGECALRSCDRTVDPDSRGRAMHVDHCHKTGQVRGILCSLHNRGIGLFADDPQLLMDAAEYLLHTKDVLREECIERLETATTS